MIQESDSVSISSRQRLLLWNVSTKFNKCVLKKKLFWRINCIEKSTVLKNQLIWRINCTEKSTVLKNQLIWRINCIEKSTEWVFKEKVEDSTEVRPNISYSSQFLYYLYFSSNKFLINKISIVPLVSMFYSDTGTSIDLVFMPIVEKLTVIQSLQALWQKWWVFCPFLLNN